MKPNFLIIGAARSGTTSIYHNLREHPDIFMTLKKEPQFFTVNWHRGLSWYQGLFSDWNGESAIGEASVTYTYPQFTEAPARIAKVLSNVRLLYFLRNPIDRTYSHYLYYRNYRRNELLPFEKAIWEHNIYLGTSQYHTWIQRYLRFFPRDHLMVQIFEDYIANPDEVIRQIFQFLKVDPTFRPTNLRTKTNQSFKPRNHLFYNLWRYFSLSPARQAIERFLPEALRPQLRNVIHATLGKREQSEIGFDVKQELQEFFEPEIIKLEEFLERDLSIWRI